MTSWARSAGASSSATAMGRQIVRRTGPEGTVTQTLVGYQWNLNNTAIELFYFGAQDEANVFRTLSVHYKEL